MLIKSEETPISNINFLSPNKDLNFNKNERNKSQQLQHHTNKKKNLSLLSFHKNELEIQQPEIVPSEVNYQSKSN